MSSCIQGELSFGPPANDDDARDVTANDPLTESEELASNDDREQTHLDLPTLLAKLSSQETLLSLAQTRRLQVEMVATFGPPHSTHGHARQWRFDTEDAHGQLGTLSVNLPHDPERVVSVTFTPPSSGTWIDESLDFSQERLVEHAARRVDDPTGGKAIARALLARLQRSST